jgi:hypothetical protein
MSQYETTSGRGVAQVVSRRPLTAKTRVRARVSPCGIYGGQGVNGTCFYPSSSVLSCQYHSAATLHAHMSFWDERKVRWWRQFRDAASFHGPKQHGASVTDCLTNKLTNHLPNLGCSNMFSPLDRRILFTLYPRAKRRLLAWCLKTNDHFVFNNTYSVITNYHTTCSDINFI